MKYYLLTDDKRIHGRWFLKGPTRGDGESVDPRTFTAGRYVDASGFNDLIIPVRRPGVSLDFTLADFDMPVLREDLAKALYARCGNELQLVPASVEGTGERFAILNLTQRIACLDEEKSGVTWWTPQDGRPEKVGSYMIVTNPQVDANRVGGHHIFRIEGWEIAMIVSEAIVDLLRSNVGPMLQPA